MSAPTNTVKSARTSPEASKKSAAKVQQLPSPTKSPKQPAGRSAGGGDRDAVKLPSLAAPSTPTKKGSASATKASSTLPNGVVGTKGSPSSKPSGSPKTASKPGKTVLPLHRSPSSTALSPLMTSDDATARTQELVEASLGPSAETTAAAEAEANAAAAEAKAEAEAARIRKERGNGMIKLIYEQYDEEFPIVDGSTTQSAIDDVYCLSFVMPECLVHLSRHAAPEWFAHEDAGVFDSLLQEHPQGVYMDLEKDTTYYIVVEQEADRLKRDQDATRARWEPQLQRDKRERDAADDGRGFESCSCVYGSPCVDEYGCRD